MVIRVLYFFPHNFTVLTEEQNDNICKSVHLFFWLFPADVDG